MSGVYHCSPTNSTNFTTCCGVAITDPEQRCPRCKEYVYPFYEGMTERERDEAAGGCHNHRTSLARFRAAERNR